MQILSFWFILLGMIFFLVGNYYRLATIRQFDTSACSWLYSWLAPYKDFFVFIWPLGTTPVTIVFLAVFTIPDMQAGIIFVLVHLGIAFLETLIKKQAQRSRPYVAVDDIHLHQPKVPKDSSFPSGDAMRVWFVSILLPFAFGLPSWVYLITSLVALAISFGRIALGVHYPLDVIAGSGLGLIGAGIATLLIGL
jgi:membrane-associated phospholipid phosphatase